jgi:flagellar biosynthesis chaperone FliJ
MVQSFIFNLNTKVREKSPETYHLKKKYKSTNNDLQNTQIKLKIE